MSQASSFFGSLNLQTDELRIIYWKLVKVVEMRINKWYQRW
jgi:hypothetical protein